MLKQTFLETLLTEHPENTAKYDYAELPKEFKMGTPLSIRCLTHGKFLQSGKVHIRGSGCPTCGQLNRAKSKTLSRDEFLTRAKIKHGDIYDYSGTEYIHGKEKIEIRCLEHGLFSQYAADHLNGHGCRECHLKSRRSDTESFIRRSVEIHGKKYDYTDTIYFNKRGDVKIRCLKHGEFKQRAGSHLRGYGCPRCNESKGEVTIASILTEWGINFIREYRISEALFFYDFFLPDQNILIEFHGLQHYKPIEHFGGEVTFQGVVKRDKEKEELASSLDIPLIKLNFKHLENGTIRQSLIHELRNCYKHWFRIDGEIKTFRYTRNAAEFLNLPKTYLFKHLENMISNDKKVLF